MVPLAPTAAIVLPLFKEPLGETEMDLLSYRYNDEASLNPSPILNFRLLRVDIVSFLNRRLASYVLISLLEVWPIVRFIADGETPFLLPTEACRWKLESFWEA